MLCDIQQLACAWFTGSEIGLFLNWVLFYGWCYSVQYDSFKEFVRMTQEGYWSVTIWNRRVLSRLQYGDTLGLSIVFGSYFP